MNSIGSSLVAKWLTILSISLVVMPVSADFNKLRTGHDIYIPTESKMPELHKGYIDPVFGTNILRITSPSQVKGLTRIRHYYSKSNPFNADESRAIMFGSDGSKWLYDTKTWEPLGSLKIISSDPEIQWHPTEPDIFYHMDFVKNSSDVRGFYKYNIKTNDKVLLRDFSNYDTARGRLEGNLDKNGRYYALIGYKDKKREIFVYDINTNTVSKTLSVTERMAGDWISVSPSGKYVVMMGGGRSRIYDIKMNLLHELPKGTYGHADLCIGSKAEDHMVFDGADYQLDGNRNINIVNLKTGKITKLVRIGWRSTPHVSCRNFDKPGWALISTQGPDKKYPNHDFEIFWVRMDNSGEVRRVAHHHSSRENGGYFAEQHAVTNRSGSKIIFTSNWGKGSISDFLITNNP